MIYICYSVDYEVYFGGNTVSERQTLIEPTAELLRHCSRLGIPMTLFCDVACVWRYRELTMDEFPALIEEQLNDALQNGHDVQAHLHPHWFSTEIERCGNGCRYHFKNSVFLLGNHLRGDYQQQRSKACSLLLCCRQYLENLLCVKFPDYKCIAFRAGGYGIQPKTDIIIGALIDAGYRIDSSVVPGMVMESNVNRIDFSNTPGSGNYYLSPDKGLGSDATDGIFEVPVAACDRVRTLLGSAFVRRTCSSVMRRLAGKRKSPVPRRGYAIQTTDTRARRTLSGVQGKIQRECGALMQGWKMLELCDDAALMFGLTKTYISRHTSGGNDLFLSFSCHSKSLTPVLLSALGEYHCLLKKEYHDSVQAVTYQNVNTLIDARSSFPADSHSS
jgi:hypothetical protein